MSEFKDRISLTLNRKILNVKSVERDESGEIVSMEVEVIRSDDEGLRQKGTQLNAESLTKVVNSMIEKALDKTIDKTIDDMLTDIKKLELDIEKINVPKKTFENFTLPQTGFLGSIYHWEIVSGQGILLEGENAIINRQNDEDLVILVLHAINGSSNITKKYEVIVPRFYIPENVETENYRVSVFPDGSCAGVDYIFTTVDANSVFVVENEYSDYFSVTPEIQGEQLCITVFAGGCPLEGGTGEVTCSVRVDDATDGITSKIINITVEFTDSVEGED